MKQTNAKNKRLDDSKQTKDGYDYRRDKSGLIDHAYYDRKARSLRSEVFVSLAGKLLKLSIPICGGKHPKCLHEKDTKNPK
jgi:hypothetical protein